MKFLLLLSFIALSFQSFSQTEKNSYLKITSGYQLFGSGDVPGYVAKVEYATKIKKNSQNKYGRLFVGPELSFENGVKNPKVQNPSFDEFISKGFAHLTNVIITGKISYYPFNKIISGLNICAGPSIGYSNESKEAQASLISLGNGQTIRSSYLSFDNKFIFGYRISAGYDVIISKKIITGVLVQLANYNNGDFNSFFWSGYSG